MGAREASVHVVAALIRRNADVLLVRQQGLDDLAPSWSLPGGVVEPGELLCDALMREVAEETGLTVLDPGRVLFIAQQQFPPGSWRNVEELIDFVFEVEQWTGEVGCVDPDGLVTEACFVSADDAIELLKTAPLRIMREPVAACLRGRTSPGAIWFYRRSLDGSDELITMLDGRADHTNPARRAEEWALGREHR